MAAPTPPEAPTSRLITLDATRAVALLGVLVVNMLTLSGLVYLTPEMRAVVHGPGDRVVAYVLAVLVEGKALAAFSLLFGVSFTLLIGRMRARGEPWVGAYLRRLALLGAFGLINAALFFWGDILTTYAVLGLFLPLALLLPQRVVLGLAGVLLLGLPVALALAGVAPPPPLDQDQLVSLRAFQEPSFAATVTHNWALFTGAAGAGDQLRLVRYGELAALFLVGLAAGRAGLPGRLEENRVWLRRLALGLLVLGLTMEAARRTGMVLTPGGLLLESGDALVGMAYVALVALWLNGDGAARLRGWLAPLGSMALTGYLMGGLAGQAVFYGWGMAQLGRHGTLTVVGIAVGIFLLLALFARVWMARFRHGPWEWLWRSLTRLSWARMRR